MNDQPPPYNDQRSASPVPIDIRYPSQPFAKPPTASKSIYMFGAPLILIRTMLFVYFVHRLDTRKVDLDFIFQYKTNGAVAVVATITAYMLIAVCSGWGMLRSIFSYSALIADSYMTVWMGSRVDYYMLTALIPNVLAFYLLDKKSKGQ